MDLEGPVDREAPLKDVEPWTVPFRFLEDVPDSLLACIALDRDMAAHRKVARRDIRHGVVTGRIEVRLYRDLERGFAQIRKPRYFP